MTTTYETDADRTRRMFAELDSEDEALYWAATLLAGAIRDDLRNLVDQVEAISDALEAREVWDEDEVMV